LLQGLHAGRREAGAFRPRPWYRLQADFLLRIRRNGPNYNGSGGFRIVPAGLRSTSRLGTTVGTSCCRAGDNSPRPPPAAVPGDDHADCPQPILDGRRRLELRGRPFVHMPTGPMVLTDFSLLTSLQTNSLGTGGEDKSFPSRFGHRSRIVAFPQLSTGWGAYPQYKDGHRREISQSGRNSANLTAVTPGPCGRCRRHSHRLRRARSCRVRVAPWTHHRRRTGAELGGGTVRARLGHHESSTT
jgi:hypothetical protein